MNIKQYEMEIAKTRDARMKWWRDARFGLFVHYGIYSVYERGEWIKLREGISDEEYLDKARNEFTYKSGNAEKWVKLAKKAGMKYVVLTTMHHDGYSLWDSKINDFNSVKNGPGIDIVREFVDACRKHNMRIGLYFSLWSWKHPDGASCEYDLEARKRFLAYLNEQVRELMTNYGKIDILWYDVANPMKNADEWGSVERNKMVRDLQPDIIINNRSKLSEDFGTPEDKVVAGDYDWESCMRFTNICFGGLNQEYAAPYRQNANQIVKLLCQCQNGCGNLLYNISPDKYGNISEFETAELEKVGQWISVHKNVVYGPNTPAFVGTNGICSATRKKNHIFMWNWCWGGEIMRINGYNTSPVKVTCVTTGEDVDFEFINGVIHLKNLPKESPDKLLRIAVYDVDFGDTKPIFDLIPFNAREFAGI